MSDWSDVEYLLKRSYLQGRTATAPLINRENGLNFSTVGMLSKTAPDSINSQRKLLQLSAEIYRTTDKENEKMVVSDFIDNYADEFTLMLAKKLNFPSVTGSKIGPKTSNKALIQSFLREYEDKINQMVDLGSVQNICNEADSILTAIHNEIRNPVDSDDVVGLTQSICSSIVIGDEDCVMIDGSEDKNMTVAPANVSNNQANNPFMTAKQALVKNQANTFNRSNYNSGSNSYNPAMQARKLLGAKRRIVDNSAQGGNQGYRDEGRDINTEFSYYNMAKTPGPQSNNNTTTTSNNKNSSNASSKSSSTNNPEEPIDERLAGIEPKLIEMIRNEIMHRVDNITWDSIAGLEHAKNSIKEIVVWPMLRPDIFKGLRGPPKGLLLFGPPGTGKTMIGKCIASQAKATFFSISASSLTSKWVGEGEKMVRALFGVARCSQPAVIFIDEIDSLLTQRTDGEVEASRRIKTEFLVQFDGAGTNSEDRILVIGATNRPQEIDEAARRRLLKRLYIPLPEFEARATIVRNLLSTQSNSLSDADIEWICSRTEGYSGSDMDGLCREAAIGPIRSISDILNISSADVRPINRKDFEEALTQVRASVSNQDLELYLDWNQKFGSLNVKS